MIPEQFRHIKISDFEYILDEGRIAQTPLPERDQSKLLEYKDGQIQHYTFKQLPDLLPASARLVVNNAKVIPARLFFYRATGARIEVFLLEPAGEAVTPEQALAKTFDCTWNCMIGNLKKWRPKEVLSLTLDINGKAIQLNATLENHDNQVVKLSWGENIPFSSLLDHIGNMPLPPYIKRKAVEADESAYQTVFASQNGAVAAPTAGLHFTQSVFQDLASKNIEKTEVTLFVGAGTFAPVNVEVMADHPMHAEIISVGKQQLQELMNEQLRIAVGTTSLRTLESLYWMAVKLHHKQIDPFFVDKMYPYQFIDLPLKWEEAIEILLDYLGKNQLQSITGKTAIMIMPGYKFASVKALVTNFHFPKTTLMMLVAAFIGDDWQKVYHEALAKDYRFLSYGDSSLLWLKA